MRPPLSELVDPQARIFAALFLAVGVIAFIAEGDFLPLLVMLILVELTVTSSMIRFLLDKVQKLEGATEHT